MLELGAYRAPPRMARPFERFVAEWLRVHLPGDLELQVQEHMPIGERWGLRFEIDLVLYDRENGHPIAVLDTKYKPKERPETEDVERIVAYAHAKRCRKAVLLYPVALPVSFNEQVGDIRVRSLAFGLGGDLEESGQQFLTKILELMTTAG